jgi:hypothetical protein
MGNWSIWNEKKLWYKLEDLEDKVNSMEGGESAMQKGFHAKVTLWNAK